jgi:hypothetical protein
MEDSEKKPIEETKAEEESPKKEEIQSEEKTYEADEDTKKAFSDIASALTGIQQSLKALHENQQKAMEEPTDYPIAPKGNADSEDIGADVTVPAKPYVSNSEQASLHDDKSGENKPESDQSGLSMQEKTHIVGTERPGAAGVGIQKSLAPAEQVEEKLENPILKAFRTKGFQNAELIARDINSKKYEWISKDTQHVWAPGVDA